MSNWLSYIINVLPWIVTGFLLCLVALIAAICMKHWQR
jgi:hypothetical protein